MSTALDVYAQRIFPVCRAKEALVSEQPLASCAWVRLFTETPLGHRLGRQGASAADSRAARSGQRVLRGPIRCGESGEKRAGVSFVPIVRHWDAVGVHWVTDDNGSALPVVEFFSLLFTLCGKRLRPERAPVVGACVRRGDCR